MEDLGVGVGGTEMLQPAGDDCARTIRDDAMTTRVDMATSAGHTSQEKITTTRRAMDNKKELRRAYASDIHGSETHGYLVMTEMSRHTCLRHFGTAHDAR